VKTRLNLAKRQLPKEAAFWGKIKQSKPGKVCQK
jgi:hypothetical protein